jgi:glycolate oxidase FAD binding subunit
MQVVEPASAEEVSATLSAASQSGHRVLVRGGGTKIEWVQGVPEADITLQTSHMNNVVAHRAADLTATIEAGARLDDVNAVLAKQGQWIPLDPAWSDRATIGGIVATNDSGPRRHRYGAPRDLIIGIEIVRVDGVRAKAGGIVVKNVAGYDLARLMTGSNGSLAVIVAATFKLFPLSPASRTVVVDLPTDRAAAALTAALNSSQLTPTAVELQSPPLRILVRFESIGASVERQAAQVARLAAECGGRAATLAADDENREWRLHAERPWIGTGAVVKLTLLPSDLISLLDAIGTATDCGMEVIGRAGLGVMLLGIDGDLDAQERVIVDLRGRFGPPRGSLVILRGSRELRSRVDTWGSIGDALPAMQAVKHAFDPQALLNPGRGPGGI